MGNTTFEWPRGAEARDTEALELWLAVHGWEVDPTVFMAGGLGPAVQVQPIGGACQDGEPGLLILPGETVEYARDRIRIAPRSTVPAACGAS
ncbi:MULTISPECIES: hypothetical protein [Streptomyces]|uniref:DUF2007 domain-containing protein n=2 Tax=Streptomyces virginiae TaxID=1961 RepID=A0ABZ1TNB5_STRVG|nr:hypothetical protein [Streptomyces virginiae]MCX4960483.1 hypothetical protein [Streptomyces virginiae]WTB26938.1 hypothetical protein OG253_38730 [Streptomyces virginiae]